MKTRTLFASFAICLLVSSAAAQVPLTTSYQGVLTDAEGNAVDDGSYPLTFSLYDSASEGTMLWSEEQEVSVVKGLFQALLGALNPLALPFDKPYWLGIAVGEDLEMLPRVALSSAPYALSARTALLEPENGTGITIRDESGEITHILSSDGFVLHSGDVILKKGLKADSDVVVREGGIEVQDGSIVIPWDKYDQDPPPEPNDRVVIGREGIDVRFADITAEGFHVVVDGDTLVSFNPDGTSYHKGLEEYAGGIKVSGEGNGITFPDGTTMTTASAGGSAFNGILAGKDLVILDAEGNEVIRLNADGTSFHAGRETYAGGITVDGSDILVTGQNGDVEIGEPNPANPTGEVGVRVSDADGELVAGLYRKDLDTGETIGVVGRALNEGDLAGLFQGDVEIEDGGGLYIISANGDTLTAFFPDGTSYHSGLEEYAGGIEISGDGNGITFPDGSKLTTAATSGQPFNGVLFDKDLIILNDKGEQVIRLNSDGTSFHSGQEIFEGGIFISTANGNGIVFDDGSVLTTADTFDGTLEGQDLVIKDDQGNEVIRFNADGRSFHSGLETYEGGILVENSDLTVNGVNGGIEIGEPNPADPTGQVGVAVRDANGELIGALNRKDLDTGETIGVVGRALNEGDVAGLFQGDVEIEDGGGLYIISATGDTLTAFYPDGTSFHSGLEEYAGGIQISGEGNGIAFPDGTQLTTATATEFDGRLKNKDLVIEDALGNEVIRLNSDGTSFHSGLEIFEGGIFVKTEDGNGIVFDDGSVLTTADTFEGVLEAQNLVIKDADGNEVTRFNYDGTSFHTGLETYEGGILVEESQLLVTDAGGDIVLGDPNPANPTGEVGVAVRDANGELIGGLNRKDLDTGETIGVVGRALNEGDLAGLFQGDVEIEDGGGLYIISTNGDTLTAFFPDGTSFHSGLEEYAGGIQITGEGNGIAFPDGTQLTTASATEFDGRLQNRDLVIEDALGNEVIRLNSDGTSFHAGEETFAGGIILDNSELTILNDFGSPAVTVGLDEEGSGRIHSTGSLRLGNSIVIDGVAHTIDSDDPLEVLVAGQRALRLEPTAVSPNVIGGHVDNSVTPGAFGATVSGGGAAGSQNRSTDNYGFVGGGFQNRAGDATGATDSAPFATVSGGELNTASAESATVAGGNNNTASGIGAFIGGGGTNSASGANAAVVAGSNNDAGGFEAVIAGGSRNEAAGEASAVAGGQDNTATGNKSAIGGGEGNQTQGPWSVVGGGQDNTAITYAVVGGGHNNSASNLHASVGGGIDNAASASNSRIGGGKGNVARRSFATIAGGETNSAGDSVSGTETHQSVGGGFFNFALGAYSTVPGGSDNLAGGDYSFAAGRNAKSFVIHDGVFLWADANDVVFNSVASNEFAARATGGVRFVTAVDGTGSPTAGVQLSAGGSSWSVLSDRNSKTDFEPVDSDEILEALAAMPVLSWRYKTQDAEVRHVGPMAQDFRQAFGLGESEHRIDTIDLDGVALASVKGLYERLTKLESVVEQLQSENQMLRSMIAELESRMSNLESKVVSR